MILFIINNRVLMFIVDIVYMYKKYKGMYVVFFNLNDDIILWLINECFLSYLLFKKVKKFYCYYEY